MVSSLYDYSLCINKLLPSLSCKLGSNLDLEIVMHVTSTNWDLSICDSLVFLNDQFPLKTVTLDLVLDHCSNNTSDLYGDQVHCIDADGCSMYANVGLSLGSY